jgi:hypothetical protein
MKVRWLMNQLSIIIRELTHELNNVVEEIEMCENDDDKMTMLFRAGMILEDIRKLLMGKPVARYDTENKQPYLFYPYPI